MLDANHEIFRVATQEDIPELLALGEQFFGESEFGNFTEFAPDHMLVVLDEMINKPSFVTSVFRPDGQIRGFIAFTMDMSYTKDPIGLLFLLYVTPEYRKSPAGRNLVEYALAQAKAIGCKAFYAGGMSGVPGTKKSIGNMFRKIGFEETDFWGRIIL